jgi:hypothetical protein
LGFFDGVFWSFFLSFHFSSTARYPSAHFLLGYRTGTYRLVIYLAIHRNNTDLETKKFLVTLSHLSRIETTALSSFLQFLHDFFHS